MIQALRRTFHRLGYDVTRKPPEMTQPGVELSVSIELLAAVVHAAVRRPVFLQVGANDGQANDPLVRVAMEPGWRGILVEPQPRAFDKLQAFHHPRPQLFLKRAAVGRTNEPRVLYSIRDTPGLPDWALRISSFDRQHVLKSQRYVPNGLNVSELLEADEVPCITFEKLLAEANIDHVDILQVDTEGFDYEILKLFDIPRRLPAVVGFEHGHLSKSDWNDAVGILAGAGYQVGKSGIDTIAFRRASLPQPSGNHVKTSSPTDSLHALV